MLARHARLWCRRIGQSRRRPVVGHSRVGLRCFCRAGENTDQTETGRGGGRCRRYWTPRAVVAPRPGAPRRCGCGRAVLALAHRGIRPLGRSLAVEVVPIGLGPGVDRGIDELRRLDLGRIHVRRTGLLVEKRDRGPPDLIVADRKDDLLAPVDERLPEGLQELIGDREVFPRCAALVFWHLYFELRTVLPRAELARRRNIWQRVFPVEERRCVEDHRYDVAHLRAAPGSLFHGYFLGGGSGRSEERRVG